MTAVALEAQASLPAAASRPRLDHIDAIRPVKQLGVVTTHSVISFAPSASLLAGGSLMLLHVSREAFLFVSACMLTYANPDVRRIAWASFARRRAVSIVVPYVAWTLIYWASQTSFPLTSTSAELGRLLHLLLTGYDQLYYLLVIAQFYLLFPLVLLLIHACRRHPARLLAASALAQLTITGMIHWYALPPWMEGLWATREVTSYQFYLVGGALAAAHLESLERWISAHAVAVLTGTVFAAGLAEAWYIVSARHVFDWMGSASDPFQPIVLPFNVGAILSLYLLGRVMVASGRSARFRAWVRRGSDASYGVFLGHMLFITILLDAHWGQLRGVLPWELVVVGAAVIAYGSAGLLATILYRTPLSRALTGQRRLRPTSRVRVTAAAAAAAA
jgi:peptidoglycan/LPS O-acetylase OafA/YrhL